jgi:hypothetical protein
MSFSAPDFGLWFEGFVVWAQLQQLRKAHGIQWEWHCIDDRNFLPADIAGNFQFQ